MSPTELEELYFQAVRSLESGSTALSSEFVTLEPNSERSAVLKSRMLELDNNPDRAMALLEEFVQKNLQSGVARGNLARLQWKQGQTDKALSTLRFALAQAPNQERTLHFYAALLEEQHGFDHMFGSLLSLSAKPGVWLPAWVAAVLAGSRGDFRVVEAMEKSARQSQGAFPPSPDSFFTILGHLSQTEQSRAWSRLRPYCVPIVREQGDERFALAPALQAKSTEHSAVAGSIFGGTAAHPILKTGSAPLLMTPVRLIKPENWDATEIAGALGRGLALLIAESLAFEYRVVLETVIHCTPEGGIHFHQDLPPLQDLKDLAKPTTQELLSAYLSRDSQGDFTLDCERYTGSGDYIGHLTVKASDPGSCALGMADRLSKSSPRFEFQLPQWHPNTELESLMARDTAAAFLLIDQGALHNDRLPNPGLSLDLLAEHSAESQNPLDLLSYWSALCSAERMGIFSAGEQRTLVENILQKDEMLVPFIAVQRTQTA